MSSAALTPDQFMAQAGARAASLTPDQFMASQAPPSAQSSGFWDTLKREGKAAVGSISGIPAGVYHAFAEPPTPEERAEFKGDVEGPKRIGLAIHRLTTAPIETAANWYGEAAQGKIPGAYEQALSVAPEAIGQGAGTAISGKLAESVPAALKKGAEVVKSLPDTIRPGAVVEAVRNVTPKQAAQVAGGVSGGVAGHGTLSAPGAYYGAKGAGSFVESVLGKERANAPIFPRPEPYPSGAEPPAPAIPPNQLPQIPGVNTPPSVGRLPAPPEPTPPIPGVNVPPSIERIQGFQPQTAGVAPAPAAPAPAAMPNVQALDQLLNQATGGQKLVPGVSLRNQPAAMRAAGKLPEGFTPVESSALKGYKYNPGAQEFESITKTGQHYVHGDVSPEQFDAFEGADSKGKAWNDLRSQSPLVAKVVNGKRIASSPGMGMRSASPEEAPPTGTTVPTEANQLGLLQKMLEDALRQRAAQGRQ